MFLTAVEITKFLKSNQFVENIDGWKRGFVKIILKKEGVYIYHDINNKKNIKIKVENPLLTLKDWIKYMETI